MRTLPIDYTIDRCYAERVSNDDAPCKFRHEFFAEQILLTTDITMPATELDRLVDTVLATSKYRAIAPDLVRNVGAQELDKRRTFKEAIKATKNKLHQIAAVYQTGHIRYDYWLQQLRDAPDQPALQAACASTMAHHVSTRERLPFIESFYTTLFTGLPPINTILDLACGLNPLAIPWMGLAGDVRYIAYDIYRDQADFLNRAFPLLGVRGRAHVVDLLQQSVLPTTDVALLLKTIPCLEQADKDIGQRLFNQIDAPVLIISFPLRSLGGHEKGMCEHYERHFYELVAGRDWTIDRYVFQSELVYRIRR